MKKIKLTKNKYTIVDDEDYEYLNQFNWYLHIAGYAVRSSKNKKILMHREIMLLTDPKILTDHKNRNKLDNRKNNLRVCNKKDNAGNSKKIKNTSSIYKGVHWSNKEQRWVAIIHKNNKPKFLGQFKLEKDAARVYNKAAKEYFKEFANLNKIKE